MITSKQTVEHYTRLSSEDMKKIIFDSDQDAIILPRFCSGNQRLLCEEQGYCEHEAMLLLVERMKRFEVDKRFAERNGGITVKQFLDNSFQALVDVETYTISAKAELLKCRKVKLASEFKIYEEGECTIIRHGRKVQRPINSLDS